MSTRIANMAGPYFKRCEACGRSVGHYEATRWIGGAWFRVGFCCARRGTAGNYTETRSPRGGLISRQEVNR